MNIPSRWIGNAVSLAAEDRPALVVPFLAITSHVLDTGWGGACHAVAALTYILFAEAGATAALCMGEAAFENGVNFDHSWVEVDADVFDAAILGTHGGYGAPPTFRSRDLETLAMPSVRYGVTTGQPPDDAAATVLATPFLRFMSRYPGHPEGLWGVARLVAQRCGFSLSVRDLKQRHGHTGWQRR
jgi:hypothetical protein